MKTKPTPLTKEQIKQVKKDLDIFIRSVVEDSGDEQFITNGYGFYDDLLEFAKKIKAQAILQERSRVVDNYYLVNKNKIKKYQKKYNQTDKRKNSERHRYHKITGKKFENCKLCGREK